MELVLPQQMARGTLTGTAKTPGKADDEPSGLWARYLAAVSSITRFFSWGNRKKGEFTANWPWVMLSVSVALGVLCCIPWAFMFELESDPDILCEYESVGCAPVCTGQKIVWGHWGISWYDFIFWV